ncbi:protein IQ-DOMAIN 14-like isoform X1 [Salvia hispanica]|uniref:protein IQ-DOMAIN 14-like isoform X1 n=2 Tax=Salvia hispanica TaxID=49212 RepID=UPI0020099358|nr:protein IQ-DOMAIN 14-like isoform X1 [Salvia hispanica]
MINAENMGKKGSWFSAIKRVFTNNSKEKGSNGSDKKSSSKEKKKGKGILRRGESQSFIPLFGEPSSIEKILGEADQLLIRPSPRVPSPIPASPKAASPPAFTSEAAQGRGEIERVQRPETTLRDQQLSATKIQAAYRGYVARGSFRPFRGLVRLQVAVKGQNVKQQTRSAMKQMQFLVRVQTQIQSRRIQTFQHHTRKSDKAGQNEDWDDSRLSKGEAEARVQKRVEAVVKRERAMAYAYSKQLRKSNPKSTQNSADVRSDGFPWSWNWLERKLPRAAARGISLTRAAFEFKPSPQPHGNLMFDNHESATPRSSNSLVSCPLFSVPNYMAPTVSAKARARVYSNPWERFPGTPGSSDSKRRFSFPLTPNAGSCKWNKGSSSRDSDSRVGTYTCEDARSIGDLSVDSPVSIPAGLVGRKPLNRFV